jgi:hypothetical protein
MRENTKKQTQFRQGDVLVERVDFDPKSRPHKVVPRDGGRVVLAYGEVTGHAHAIAEAQAEMIELETGERFIIVKGGIRLESAEGRSLLPSYEGKTGVLLRHEEHHAHGFTPGSYRVIRQHEYSPEEIRNVAD